jgi:glycosyltransferase involved in cell wall biosynthesis
MPPITLSVVLITKNEAHNIAACLKSVAFADEWIVVDSGSTDDTCEIARSLGAMVVSHTDWPGFGAQKNRALDLARGSWVLSIDADERVSKELAASIQSLTRAPLNDSLPGYALSRLSSFCGQWMRHGDWYPDRVLRLFKREAGRFSADRVHERLVVQGECGRLAGELLHHTMASLDEAIDKMNRYSSGRALDRAQAGQRGGLAAALGHGLWAFVRCYGLRRGFLDGRLGFVLALYVAEGTYYRYLKMSGLGRMQPPPSAHHLSAPVNEPHSVQSK